MLEEAIFNEIVGDTTLAPKLAVGDGTFRVYPMQIPDGVEITQAITYTEIDQSLTYPLVRSSTFQISCIAKTFEQARAMADDIDRIFNDRSEDMLGGVKGIKYVKFVGRSFIRDTDAELYVVPVELFIKY